MRQLVGQDAAFLHVETATVKTHFTLLTIYDQSTVPGGRLRYRDILEYFEQRLTPLPVFRRRIVEVPFQLDAPYFVDDPNYHIESHVRHIALPKPGDWRQFCILVAQIQATPMDLSKPLWDMHVVEGLDNVEGVPPNSFAILTRLHHSIADGTTARGIMMALHHAKGQELPKPPVGVREPEPTIPEMAIRAVINNAYRIWELEKHLIKALPGLGGMVLPAAGKLLPGRRDAVPTEQPEEPSRPLWPVPATIFNQEMDYRRVFQLRVFALEDIARMRRAVEGSTVNDVVLVLVGEALRRYLARMKKSVKSDLYAICPINIRRDKLTNESLAGNDISLMTANLRTTEPDLLERLRKVTGGTRTSKKVQEASSVKELVAMSKQAPNLLLALASRIAVQAALRASSTRPLSNAIITNVPGPQEPLYFMGAKLVLFSGGTPIAPVTGLTIPITSYDGRLIISFTGAASWVKDPQGLAECLDESFEAMKQALGSQAVAAVNRKAGVAARRKAKSGTRTRSRTKATGVSRRGAGSSRRRT